MTASPNTPPVRSQAPKGARHVPRRTTRRKVLLQSSGKLTDEQHEAIKKEIELLPDLIKVHYTNWKDGAKPFQLESMAAQVLGQDVLLHAATGSGKTGIAAGPHLLPSSKGKVTLVVSPLLSLHEEQVSMFIHLIQTMLNEPKVTTFEEEFHLKAMSINSTNGGCSKETLAVGFNTVFTYPLGLPNLRAWFQGTGKL